MPAKQKRIRIPLFDVAVTSAAKQEVASVLQSGWLSTGPKARALEAKVASLSEVKHAVAVSSATAGLQVALMALDLPSGSEVITTPLTMVATVEAILLAGLRPVLADIDSESLTIDPESVAKRITSKTSAILPVDLAGMPCDYDALRAIAGKRKLAIVSDSAHAFGTLYKKKPIARYADMTVYSFYSTKNLACGEGGMILTRDAALAKRARLISRHGMTSNAFDRKGGRGWSYDVPHFGIKANMSDLHAAVGLGQLTRFDADRKRREEIAQEYLNRFDSLQELVRLPHLTKNARSSWHLFILRLNTNALSIARDRFIELMRQEGIECGVHYRPIYELSHYAKRFGWKKSQFPNTAQLARQIVSIPLYPKLTDAKVKKVAATVRRILIDNRRNIR